MVDMDHLIIRTNTIEFITISSTGNAQDFGDVNVMKLESITCGFQIVMVD